MNFYNFFLLLWAIFALLDPDPLTQLNPDSDPQPCCFGQGLELDSIGSVDAGRQKSKMTYKIRKNRKLSMFEKDVPP
jgi:hypothetical protein